MDSFVCGEDFGACFAGHGLHVYVIAVIIVDDQHVGVAGNGGLDEASREIAEDFAGVRGEVGVDEVEFVVGGFLEGGCSVVIINWVVLEGGVAIAGVIGWREFWFARVWSRCPLTRAADEGGYFRTCADVRSGQVQSKLSSMALHHVDRDGEKRVAW